MRIANSFFFAVATCVLISCKPGQNNPVPLGGGTTYSGRLYALKSSWYYASDTGALTSAEFFKQPQPMAEFGTGTGRVQINGISANGRPLSEALSGKGPNNEITEWTYGDAAFGVNNGITWDVNGNNGIPSFTWQDAGAYPKLLGTLPDSISIAQGFDFDFSAGQIANADTAKIWFEAAAPRKGVKLPGHITYAPGEISSPSVRRASMFLWFGKYATQSFGGKDFISLKAYLIEKVVVLY